jgi:hypothetical protein
MKMKLFIIGLISLVIITAGCGTFNPESFTQPAPVSPSLKPAISATTSPKSTVNSVTTNPTISPSGSFESKPFPGTIILGRPTADSITLSFMAPANTEIFVRYGRSAGKYEAQTVISGLQEDQPSEIKITGLDKDTQYFYRVCYRADGEYGFSAGVENTFHTQRTAGESFVFTVDADPHFDNNTDQHKVDLTFQNILNQQPDFNIDLGDTFMTEKIAASSDTQVAAIYAQRRSDFSILGNSVPLYLVMGNHDGELGWLLNGTENNAAIWASKARELYYSNPVPGDFYSGDNKTEPFVGLRQNYYAWEWGNALFITLDPYWYSQGGKNSNGWNLTLGKDQYDWLKTTLENSLAKYKFVFAHNLVGGLDMGNTGNMRGGIEAAGFYEWGGQNTDGTWGFDINRPNWGKPIQQLLAENNVTIFFHGHDHFFAKQDLNGVVYQGCPQPGAMNDKNHASEYGYEKGTFLDGTGNIRVTISEEQVKVDYVRTYLPGKEPVGHKNGEVAYSYTIIGN